jgi:ubiquinone/menaquinone biosynthesis C-methylase UbiE
MLSSLPKSYFYIVLDQFNWNITVKKIFQPLDGLWQEHAGLGVLRSVLDPQNTDNRKNKYLHAVHTQAVKSILPEIKNLDVLDFGCGTGRFSLLLSGKARNVIGFDITPEMITTAQRENSTPNIHYGIIDGTFLPLKDSSVDFIVSVWVLQYAARKQVTYKNILEEFRRVLRPGGRFFALEQVSFADEGNLLPECSLRLDDYLTALEQFFLINKAYPIRGARKRSFLQKFAEKRNVPDFLYPLIATLTIRSMKKTRLSDLNKYPYVDYVLQGMLQ